MLPFVGIMLILLSLGIVIGIATKAETTRKVALLFSGIAALIAIYMLFYSVQTGQVAISESYNYYISSFSIPLNFTLNPISLALLLMSSIVTFVTILAGNVERESEKASSLLIMLFDLAATGLFASGNLFLFFIFWDVGVIALFFMIYLLGSSNRRRAAMKFLVYEILASMFLLFAIMLIYFYTPIHSFDISYIIANAALIPLNIQILIFAFLFIAFIINMPIFPLHLWLPEAHTEASTQGSMLLSGVLTKFGGYGMILTFMMMPVSALYSGAIAALAGFSAFYAAFVLMTQHDLKRIIAYTTIVEMGIILVGIASLNTFALAGATYAMLAHGFTITLLFLASGSIAYIFAERDVRSLRGVVSTAVSTSYSLLIGIFATTGVPLTAAFIGDVLIVIGATKAFSIFGALPIVSLILLGAYLYYVVNKSILSTKETSKSVEFIGRNQAIGYSILLFFIFLFGALPFIILNLFNV